jgi:predicted nucleic acid-binding protein
MPEKQRQQLENFFSLLPVWQNDRERAARAAKLRAEFLQTGINFSVRDALLIQLAIESNATLLTSDPFFLEVQRLRKISIQLN